MVVSYTPRMIGYREILKSRENEKYEVEHSFREGRYDTRDRWFVNVFRKRKDGTKRWLQTPSREYLTKKSGVDRFRKMTIKYIIGAETWSQFVDEITGFLGNHTWTGEKRLALLAKDQRIGIASSFFELEEEDILAGLKQLQAEGYLQDFE